MCVRCVVCVGVVAVLLSQAHCTDPPVSGKEHQHTEDMYVPVGSAVHVPCDGEGAHWELNRMVLNRGPILSIPNTGLEDRGNYTCHSKNGLLLRTLSLQPGYPPSRPKVQCSSPGYPLTATCHWTEESEPVLPTHYTATYRIGRCSAAGLCAGHAFQPCHPIPGMKHHCLLKIQLFHHDAHVINVTATNPLGSNSTLFSFIVEDVVKPDPPVNVRVTQKTARQLYVEWAPPPSWADPIYFPLKYKVRYHQGNSEAARELGPYESQSMVLKGLRPGSTYVVQVTAQDQLVGQSSDWSEPVTATVLSH